MFLADLFEASTLPAGPVVNSPAFKAWFRASKVVDADGNPLPVYHGTGRPDRVGTQFKKSRATAGPMAYFTDDPTVAGGYAQGKPDTSIEDADYDSWFKVKLPGYRSLVPLPQAWWSLPSDEKTRLVKLAPMVTRNDDDEIVVDDQTASGLGGFQDHLRQSRGNVLKALIEEWLTSGALFNDEDTFLKVLKLAGMTTPIINDDPRATYPAIYAVYMSIQQPLDTGQIPPAVLAALEKAAGRQRSKPNNNSFYGQWDKKTADAREWFQRVLQDIENKTAYVWTVIPDWVTKTLQDFGYDGIKDTGGKQGGVGHVVWIPFEEHQVKSALSNTKFNPDSGNIHK